MDGGSLWEKLWRGKMPADARQSNATHSDGRPLAKRGKAPVIDRFGDLLPYVGYDEKTQLFALEGLRAGEYEGLGYALEVTPQIGATKALADAMLNLLSGDCPAGTAIQVTLFATPRIEAYLQRMVECSVDPASARGQVFPEQFALMRRMVEQRAEFYRRGTMAPILPNNNLRLRQFRGFFSVVYPAKRPFDRSSISEALRLRQTHIGTLQQYGLYGGTWSISDLLWYLQCVLNPQRVMHGDTPIIVCDPAVEPRRQAASPDTRIEFTEESVEFSSGRDSDAAISARCMSVRSYPSVPFYLSQMSELLGSLTNGTIAYPCPYTLTLGVSLPEYEATKNKTILAAANAQRTADLPIARFTPEAAAINEDWKLAQEAFLHGKGTVSMYLQLVLFSPKEGASRVEEIAKSVWRQVGFEIAGDRKMQQQALLSSLPMLNGPLLTRDLQLARRASTKTQDNAANMMPLVAEWKGMPPRDGDREPTPLLTLVGRRGQLISVDPYANTAGGPNMVICGQTGSGKSFLLNDLIASVLRTGGKVWVIDVGFSYRNLCEIYHGQYIDFDPKSGLCINPFELVNEPEDLDEVVKPIVAQMASLHWPLSDYELAQLQMHIKSLVADHGLGGVVPDITALAQSLISNCQLGGPNPLANDEAWRKKVAEMDNEERAKYCDPRIRDLGVQLLPFTADGNYGHFFNGPTNVEFKSNFIVLELEHLKKNKHLQAVVLMLLMQLIAHEVYLGDPSVKKLVLLDEAWDLLKVGGSAEFIEGMYRRIRKTGGACATATQSIQDYSSPAGQAALANADCMFLLRQKPESIEYLIESKKIVLDEYQLELLRSVTKTDDYSECYVRIGDHPGTVGRLIVDAYSKFIYSTKPTDRAAINAYRGQGFSLADAIQKVMADRGVQGVSALRMDARAQYTEA